MIHENKKYQLVYSTRWEKKKEREVVYLDGVKTLVAENKEQLMEDILLWGVGVVKTTKP